MLGKEKSSTKTKDDEVICGLFSKQEAAHLIGQGAHHVHSTVLGNRDACARVSQDAVVNGKEALYPWEMVNKAEEVAIQSTANRQQTIGKVASKIGLCSKKAVAERVKHVLEELITNAVYHGYRLKDGTEKYHRGSPVVLEPSDKVVIKFGSDDTGVYLCVEDHGGSLRFDEVADSFERCYKRKHHDQIETKETGAGLGLYMIFETVSHLKVDMVPGSKTCVSVWIPDKKHFDRDNFSFNFFKRG